jgi:alpha-L-fucosidase
MKRQNFSRRQFLRAGTALVAASVITPSHLSGKQNFTAAGVVAAGDDIFRKFQCPQWFKDAKFGLWLHWGPQTVPAKGAGWYSRHMYSAELARKEGFGLEAWEFHRKTYGHQSQVGFKEICNLWKAEKFDADATMRQFKKWGARYAAIISQHCDNFDLYNTSIHKWNSVHVGPKRDILGEFAAAARRHKIPWMASSHAGGWTNKWYEPAFGADKEGELKDVPYDGILTLADGKGKWWEGLDPQQLYAYKYPDFEKELGQRLVELVENYHPDVLYFDWKDIPAPAMEACKRLYANSLKEHGAIQTIITVKQPMAGTVLDFEKGIADGIQDEYWQTDTTLNEDWFWKDEPLRQNARTLKELLVDIVSKRGVLMLDLPVYPDGSIPDDQFAIMEEFGAWVTGNSEAIHETEPWKTYGAGGKTAGGHFNERTVKSEPWSYDVYRFTRSKDKKTLYVHIFGKPAGKEINITELGDKNLFSGKVEKVSLIGSGNALKWSVKPQGLSVVMPGELAYRDCNVLKIKTTGL